MGFLKNLFSKESIQARKDARLQRLNARLDKRKSRHEFKTISNVAAYEHGIDPNASTWAGISSLGKSLSSAASNIFSPAVLLH